MSNSTQLFSSIRLDVRHQLSHFHFSPEMSSQISWSQNSNFAIPGHSEWFWSYTWDLSHVLWFYSLAENLTTTPVWDQVLILDHTFILDVCVLCCVHPFLCPDWSGSSCCCKTSPLPRAAFIWPLYHTSRPGGYYASRFDTVGALSWCICAPLQHIFPHTFGQCLIYNGCK